MDFFLWGIMKDELFKPGKNYETRDSLVAAIMDLEAQFNDPDNRLHQCLENAFLGGHSDDYGRRRGGKINKITFDHMSPYRFHSQNEISIFPQPK